MPLWEWNTGGPNIGTHFWISEGGSGNPGGLGCLYANLIDIGGTSHAFASPLNLIKTNGFQHVALTYDHASGVAALYYNGTNVASQNLGSFNPQSTYPVYIGRRPYYTTTEIFSGLMDEVSLYNRSLSAAEIKTIYQTGNHGKCPPAPVITVEPADQFAMPGCDISFNVTATSKSTMGYQWLKDGSVLSGQTNSTLSLGGIQTSNFGAYLVLVTNAFGSTASASAALALDHAPVAAPVTLERFASGGIKVPMSVLLANDTDADGDLLTIIGVSSNSAANGIVFVQGNWIYYTPPPGFNNTDTYTYIVSDGHCGGTNAATVTVQIKPDTTPSGTCTIQSQANGSISLTFNDGIPGNSYRIQYNDSLTTTNWHDLSTRIADGFGSYQYTDHPPTNVPVRYYRSISP